VSTPYSFEKCDLFMILQRSKFCIDVVVVEVESAPVVPPFIYHNQCASVLLTSYIPVLILGYSIQILLSFAGPSIFFRLGKSLGLRDVLHGILWPDFWVSSETYEVESRKRAVVENDPSVILNPRVILCFDILNNLMIMLTFGLCSPILAFAVTCSVVSKMSMLVLLVGRFTKLLVGGTSDCSHFALVALSKVHFPLDEVLHQSFWIIVWTSALFMCLVCMDIAGDDVDAEWVESVWIPVAVMFYPICLWMISCGLRNAKMGGGARHARGEKETELPSSSSLSVIISAESDLKENDNCKHSHDDSTSSNPMHSANTSCD
jgi:hypothetical protein